MTIFMRLLINVDLFLNSSLTRPRHQNTFYWGKKLSLNHIKSFQWKLFPKSKGSKSPMGYICYNVVLNNIYITNELYSQSGFYNPNSCKKHYYSHFYLFHYSQKPNQRYQLLPRLHSTWEAVPQRSILHSWLTGASAKPPLSKLSRAKMLIPI